MTTASVLLAPPPRAADRSQGVRRPDIRPPKFADKFALLDFEADPMPIISMFQPPARSRIENLSLAIRGEDLRTHRLGWAALDGLPVRHLRAALVCQIFNWHEVGDWRGIRLADVLDRFELATHEEGYYAFFSGDGQYFETLSRDEARDPRAMLAIGLGGQDLPHEYGGPLRLFVPFLQGYKSVKWLSGIQAYRHDPAGIKRLLGQSKTGRLGQSWLTRLGIEPAEGRPGDP